jgi:hypothetical protein
MKLAVRPIVLLAVSLASLAFSGIAEAASPARLLAKYQPVTQFSPGESFRPTTIETFVSDSRLERLVALPNTWAVVEASPDPALLPGPGTGIWRLNQASCSPADGVSGAACAAGEWIADGAPNAVYGRVAPAGDKIVVQYWLFYYDNFYSYPFLPLGAIWQAHEGDWEVVNVVLSAEDEEPLYVGYSQHCTGERRVWSKTPRWRGTHPRVRVALGSHANHFSVGLHPIAVQCIPPAAVQLLHENGLPLPADVVGNGALAGPAALGNEPTSVRMLTAASAPWLSFPGFWGEGEYLHAPSLGTVPFGPSPVGPALHAVWQDPLGTLATWPEG